MPKYTLHRDYVHRSTLGVISFEEDVPTHVPPHMEKEVIAIGAVRAEGEGDTPKVLDPEKKLPDIPVGDEREAEIKAAFELLIDRNDSDDFTGQGVPTVKAVEKIVGFDVDRKEIVELWAAMKAEG